MANEFVVRNGFISKNDSESSGSFRVTGSFTVVGPVNFNQGLTASLFGTSSWATNVVNPPPLNFLSTGSVSASVEVGGNGIFLIKSASNAFFEVSASSETNFYSNIFVIKNYASKNPTLTVSESVVRIVTQSFDTTQTVQAGEIRFTPTALYVSLD